MEMDKKDGEGGNEDRVCISGCAPAQNAEGPLFRPDPHAQLTAVSFGSAALIISTFRWRQSPCNCNDGTPHFPHPLRYICECHSHIWDCHCSWYPLPSLQALCQLAKAKSLQWVAKD